MATNLLLEGDDLEALLLRAAAEGGANARILRAEKVRQGGFMGFFAREHFEVAVEIPDAVEVHDPDGAAAAGSVGTPAERRSGQQQGRQQGPQQGGQQGRQPEGRRPARPVRAYDEADDEQVAALVAALSQDRTPEPGMLAAEGLLGLADRVSAAERAAAGGTSGRSAGQDPDGSVDVRSGPPNALAGARARSAFERYLPQASPVPSEPEAGAGPASGWWAGVPTPAHGIAALSAANGIDGVVPWTEPVAAAAARAVDERIAADRADAAQADAERAFAEEQAAAEAVIRAAVESRRGVVPHEPAAVPTARPSTSTPEFTALLDTLRSDVRPSGPARQPAAQPAPEPVPEAVPGAVPEPVAEPVAEAVAQAAARPAPKPAARAAAAAMPLQRSAGTGSSRVQVTVEPVPPGALGGPAVDATPEPFEPLGPFRAAAAAAVAEPVQVAPEPTPAPDEPVSQHPAGTVDAATHAPTDSPVDTPADTPADIPTDIPTEAADDARTAPLAPVHPLHAAPQDGVSRIGQPVALVTPPSQRTPVPPLVPATPPSVQTARGLLVALGADDDEPYEPESTDHDGSTDLQVSADRRALRRLGVPASWTRRYKGPDRFSGVLRMLDRLPTLEIDPDTRIVAVVGPAPLVTLEAHRTALDLAIEDRPRPVVVVPQRPGQARRAAIARAQKLTAGVVAIATDDDVEGLLDTLQAVGAGAVVAVVEAGRGPLATQAWLEALDTVDALVVEGAAGVPDPATVLRLDLPVVRLDGIPVDRVTWSALLCARMLTSLGLDPVTDRQPARPSDR